MTALTTKFTLDAESQSKAINAAKSKPRDALTWLLMWERTLIPIGFARVVIFALLITQIFDADPGPAIILGSFPAMIATLLTNRAREGAWTTSLSQTLNSPFLRNQPTRGTIDTEGFRMTTPDRASFTGWSTVADVKAGPRALSFHVAGMVIALPVHAVGDRNAVTSLQTQIAEWRQKPIPT